MASVGLNHWTLNEYALTPGDATPVAPLVKIGGLATDQHRDDIMLTDVYLQQLTAWQFITMHFQSHVQFVPGAELVEPGVSASQLEAQGYLEMSDSKQDAEVSAFKALGWKLPATHTGSIVNAVVEHSPASAAKIHVADEIVSVNAKSVTTTCALEDAVHSLAPGSAVALGVERAHVSPSGVITWAAPVTVSMKTAVVPGSLGATGCPGIAGASRSWIGVALEDGYRYDFPGNISINTKYIGGPSAGLAMTLTLIDELSRGSLTGNNKVAATGTIDQYGNVGDVGGVAEKTIAVEDAGAKYFIVPEVEVATAEANASSGLHVLGVTTLRQALKDLRAIGGSKPVALTKPR
jgi:PDZ domain-containing protein